MRRNVRSFDSRWGLFALGIITAVAVLAPGSISAEAVKEGIERSKKLPGEVVAKGTFTISPGQCINENLGEGDARFDDNTYYERYDLNWPGGDLTITLDAPVFDEYLIVYPPPGMPANPQPGDTRYDVDDSYTAPEVLSLTNAEAGTYTILANHYEYPDPGIPGDYSICVSSSGTGATPTPTMEEATTPTATATPGSCDPPPTPSSPQPADSATGVSTDVTLSWNAKGIPKVIYGEDNRLDVYQVTDEDLLAAADATVLLVRPSKITANGDGTYTLDSTTFNEDVGGDLCPTEPYRDQPSPGHCSGFLVGTNLIATAGHCIDDQADCLNSYIVFGFDMLDASTPKMTIPGSDVYQCVGIVDRRLENAEDWAVIELDRPVEGHIPLNIRRSGIIANTQNLIIMGHPVGLPKKIAGGASVRTNTDPLFFVGNLDSYGGNSGSPVFNADTLMVEGVLVRGEDDFVIDGGCRRSVQCSDNDCRGEDCTRTTLFAGLVPQNPGTTSYDVYFGPCGSLALTGTTNQTSWQLSSLAPNTTFCWQVIAKNGCGESQGPIWSFTTAGEETPTPTATPDTPATGVPTAVYPQLDVSGNGRIGTEDLLSLLRDWHRPTN